VRQDAKPKEFVTGNNEADGAYLLLWAAERYPPERVDRLRAKLEQWGGNANGRNVANIDNLGNVHPDTFCGTTRWATSASATSTTSGRTPAIR
jgi:hypothetical protein